MIKRPLLLPVIFFLTGIFATDLGRDRLMSIHVSLVIGLLFLMFFLLLLLFEKPKLFYIILCLFFLFLGIFRCASLTVCGKGTIGAFAGSMPKETVLYGLVSGEPERRAGLYSPYFIFPLKAERILSEKEEHSVAGTVLVSLFNPEWTPRIGDRLVMSGRLSLPRSRKNPAGFNREAQLKRSGIGAVMSSAGNDCHVTARAEKGPLVRIKRGLSTGRAAAGGVIRKYLSQDTEAIVGSAVLGLRSGVKKQLNDIFARTGTAHVLAVSGLHVGIVAVVFMGLLRGIKCPRRPACFLTILVICVFGVFAGGRPSSIRAAIMGSFILFGMAFERKTDVMNALLLSALAVTFFRPDHLFRAGFILSYAAVLSIVWLMPLADAFLGISQVKRSGQPAIIRGYFLKLMSVSIAAWIGTMPVVVSYFRMVTPAAVLANLAAVPALFLVVTFGFGLIIAVITGVPLLFVVFIAGILDIIVSLLVIFLRAISEVPFSFVKTAAPSVTVIVVFYAGLAVMVMFFRRFPKRGRALMIMILLFAANIFLWNELAPAVPDAFRVTFFDVGKADAALLEFKGGGVMLIDGGRPGNETGGAGRFIIGPYLRQRGIRRIDCVLLTHAHEDHFGGLIYVMENFDIGTVIEGDCPARDAKKSALYGRFREIIEKKNMRYFTVKRGDVIKGFPGARFVVLNPPKRLYGNENDDSVVIKAVTEENNSILFCADISENVIKDLLSYFGARIRSDIIKIPHHGSQTAAISGMVRALGKPDCAIIITNDDTQQLNEYFPAGFAKTRNTYITGRKGAVRAEEKNGKIMVNMAKC